MINGIHKTKEGVELGNTSLGKEKLTALANSIKRIESRIRKLQIVGAAPRDQKERFIIHEEILKHSTVLYGLKERFWD